MIMKAESEKWRVAGGGQELQAEKGGWPLKAEKCKNGFSPQSLRKEGSPADALILSVYKE